VRAISGQERNLTQRVAFTRVTGNLRKIAKPDVFPVEDNLPDDIRHWIAYWSRNPKGIPRPIQEEHGLLIVEDIDVWLWGRHVAPKAYKDEFLDVLWEIFVPLGQWEELVDGAWVVPTTQALCSLPQDVFWEWPPGVTPENLDHSHLARWLGQKGGVTPTRARNLIEPYARCRAQGLYYSPQVQDAYNRAQLKRARRALTNTTSGPSSAGPSNLGLAACILEAPTFGTTEFPTLPSVGNNPLAMPLASPIPAPTSMDVDDPSLPEPELGDDERSG